MKRLVALGLTLALVATGCAASGGQDPDEPTGTGDPTTTTTEPDARTIDWSDCGGGFECGTLTVPLDYDEPDGDTIDLAVTRHRADEPDERIGALLVNPGGPGGSAVDLARSFPRAGELGDRFDIVGFDPRGVGGSSELSCNTHLQEMYDADPTFEDEQDETAYLESSQAFVDECTQRYAEILPHLGTSDVARDMDEVRKALGEEQINYLGYSYGTSLGQEYARQFPDRVRTMILDGLVDHEPDGIATATAQAAGFETALDSYVEHCETDGCGLSGPADEVIDAVSADAEDQPIPAPSADRPATPGVVSLALAQALYAEQLWSVLSAALRDAGDGDGSGLVDLADQYLGRNPDEQDSDGLAKADYCCGFEIYFAVSCLDETWPEDPQDVIAAAAEAEAETPRFGGAIVMDYLRCSLWPADAQPLEPVPADLEGLPPVLVISTTNDPATPYGNGVAVADQIPGAVLITNEGDGHTVVGQGKPCIDDAVLDYLTDLEVPEDGLRCS